MSEVTFDEFSHRFADELNVNFDDLNGKTLSEIPEFDSMGKINISLLIEELFNFQIDYEDMNRASTHEELFEMCAKHKK